MSNQIEKIEDYKQTDADSFQFGRKIRGGVYKFKEFERFLFAELFTQLKALPYKEALEEIKNRFNVSEYWIEIEISLANYSEQEIEDHISAYYADLDELKSIYGNDWMFIVAECIFEQESELY